MRIRIFLIIFIVLGFLGGVSSTIVASSQAASIRIDLILMIIAIYIVNLICASYLYNKSHNHKIEWALFGFLGNVNAILFYYARDYITSRWGKGKSILRD